jgi:hypothetical protein
MTQPKRQLTLVVCCMAAFIGSALSVDAQQAEPSPSVERVRAGLLRSQQPVSISGLPLFVPVKPAEVRWGVLAFVPPDVPGQIVNIRVPVGDLVSRAAHAVAAVQRHRAEDEAHTEVTKALTAFLNAQPK